MDSPAKHADGQGARTQIVTVETRSCTCQVDAEVRAALGPLLTVEGPEAWPPMEEVKTSTVRRVSRCELLDPVGRVLSVHVKLFRAVRLSDRARDALRGTRAATEFRGLLEARARGLPAVRPLAAGSFRGSFGSRSFLVTETVADAAALPRGPLSVETARAAGKLLRRAHDAGLHALDLHPGNLLEDAGRLLWLLDLTGVQFADKLPDRDRARALAFFCLDLDGGVRNPAAKPLVDAYGADAETLEQSVRIGRHLRHRALSAFGRRSSRDCRHTAVEPRVKGRPRWFLHLPSRDLHEEARRMGDELDRLTPLKSGRRGAVYIGEHLIMKSRSAARARRLFRAAYWLIYAGVPSPEPVGLRLHVGRGAVLVRRLPGPTLAEELEAGSLAGEDVIATARQLGAAVGRLHAHGLRNRDLKLENLIRAPQDHTVSMVDLDGIRRKTALDRRGMGADLGRLLAAFRAAGSPGDIRTIGSFRHGYNAARKCLLVPRNHRSDRHMWRLSAEHAAAWASAHPRLA